MLGNPRGGEPAGENDDALAAKRAEYNAPRTHRSRHRDRCLQIDKLEKAGFYAKAGEVKFLLDRRIAPEHVRLGLWCEQKGLKAEALAHFTTALELDPHKEATWKHLGYVKHHGRWMSHEQIAAEEHDALVQKHADRHGAALAQVGERVGGSASACRSRGKPGQGSNRGRCRRSCACSAKPRRPGRCWRCVCWDRSIGGGDDRLAVLAVESDAAEVRQAAAQALKGREPRDYGESIVNLIHTPVTYQVQPVAGPGSGGPLSLIRPVPDHPDLRRPARVQARLASTVTRLRRQWPACPHPGRDMKNLQRQNAGQFLHDAEARTAQMLADAQMNAVIARERLAADVRDLEEWDAQAKVVNQRAEDVFRVALDAPASLGRTMKTRGTPGIMKRLATATCRPPRSSRP